MGDRSMFFPGEITEAQTAINEYRNDGTIRNARIAWLKCIDDGEDVPTDILAVVRGFVAKGIADQTRPPENVQKEQYQQRVMMMLDLAKEDFDKFLDLVYPSDEEGAKIRCMIDDVIPNVVEWEYRKYQPGELYDLFGSLLDLVNEDKDDGADVGERMKSRYRTYKKNRTEKT